MIASVFDVSQTEASVQPLWEYQTIKSTFWKYQIQKYWRSVGKHSLKQYVLHTTVTTLSKTNMKSGITFHRYI